jgi:hypothetical protein
MSEQMRKALDEIGGEPLAGSGFENETTEEWASPQPYFDGRSLMAARSCTRAGLMSTEHAESRTRPDEGRY